MRDKQLQPINVSSSTCYALQLIAIIFNKLLKLSLRKS